MAGETLYRNGNLRIKDDRTRESVRDVGDLGD